MLYAFDEQLNEFKTNDHINFTHSVFAAFFVHSKLSVEDVANDETDEDHDVLQQHHFEMQHNISAATTHQVVTTFVYKPVDNAEEEEGCEAQHFVNIKGIPQHDGKQQELKDFLLRLVHDVL